MKIRKILKWIRKTPARTLNVCILSMQRCGVSAVGEVLSDIHEGLYGIRIRWKYAEDPGKILTFFPKGWHGVYNCHPSLLEHYDKVLIIKRKEGVLLAAQRKYAIAQAALEKRELNDAEWERFYKTFDYLYETVYDKEAYHDIDPKYLTLNLETFNNHTEKALKQVCEWLGFKPFTGKVVIVPVKRNWEVFSSNLEPTHQISATLDKIKYSDDPLGNIRLNKARNSLAKLVTREAEEMEKCIKK